jgi:hypothetical protein
MILQGIQPSIGKDDLTRQIPSIEWFYFVSFERVI